MLALNCCFYHFESDSTEIATTATYTAVSFQQPSFLGTEMSKFLSDSDVEKLGLLPESRCHLTCET